MPTEARRVRVPHHFAANNLITFPSPLQTRCAVLRVVAGALILCRRRAASAAAHPRLDAARTHCVACGSDGRAQRARGCCAGLCPACVEQAAVELALRLQSQDAAAAYVAETRGAACAADNAVSSGSDAPRRELRWRCICDAPLRLREALCACAVGAGASYKPSMVAQRSEGVAQHINGEHASERKQQHSLLVSQLQRSCSISDGLEPLFC